MSEKVTIDGIPIEDYGRPTSQTVYSNNYNGEINIGDTIKYNIDYWKKICFEQKERIKELEKQVKKYSIEAQQYFDTTVEQALRFDKDIENNYISKDKIKKLLKEVKEEKNKAMKSFAEKPINTDFVIDGAIGQELGYVIGLIEELLEE